MVKRTLVLLAATCALMMASACGSPSGTSGTSGEGAPATTNSVPVPGGTISSGIVASTDALPETCTPVAGGIPANAKDFNCLVLVSTSGSDATGELAWVGTDPFTLATSEQDGALHFSSKTPCNTLMS